LDDETPFIINENDGTLDIIHVNECQINKRKTAKNTISKHTEIRTNNACILSSFYANRDIDIYIIFVKIFKHKLVVKYG